MAERSILTLSQKTPKTQESMQARLEEWRKTRQQETAKQLKQQTRPLKTLNSYKPKQLKQRHTSIQPNSKTPLLHRSSFVDRKRKPVGVPSKTAVFKKITDKTTSEHRDEHRSKIVNEEPIFNDKPPQTFEIESAPYQKKARRSTFTIETPVKNISQKSKENLRPCENNEENLREKLELWRENKRKSQAKPKFQKSLKTEIKPKNEFNKGKNISERGKNSIKTSNPVKCKQVMCNVKKTEEKQRVLPKKNGPQRSHAQTKVAKATTGKVDSIFNKSNLPRSPVKLQPHMDKALSMRERLELWRKEKGKTPGITRTPATLRRKSTMIAKNNHHPITMETMESLQLEPFETMNCDLAEKESTPEEIKKKLQDCLEKVQQGNDNNIAEELDEIHKSCPGVQQCAEYWICRAKIAEHEEDEGRVVCLYEQALVFNAEPEELIKEAVAEYLQKRKSPEEGEILSSREESILTHQAGPVTPPREDDMAKQAGQPSPFDSSIIKYSVTKATPFKSRLKSCERPVVTPVRRSTRLERRSIHYPTMLQEHGISVRHLGDLPEDIKNDVLFKPNFAVQNKLNEAWKDLWNELG